MKKTISITLGGRLFNIEEDAYEKLHGYLEAIKSHYQDSGGEEIIGDIENSIAEKFAAKIKNQEMTITLFDIEEMIKVMGTVNDFDYADENGQSAPEAPGKASAGGNVSKKLYRNPDDVIIAGVCSGVAAYFGMEAAYIRILFIILIFLDGFGILAYIVLWLVMPLAKTNAQKLEMQGKPVNLKKLEETIKEKTADFKESIKNTNRKKFAKIITFPIEVIRQTFAFLKKIILVIMPFFSILIGLGIIIAAIAGIAALAFAAGALVFNINSQYLISDIPLSALAANFSYYALVCAGFLLVLIPGIFILLIGLSLIRRKNIFNLIFSFVLIGLWILAFVAAGLSALDFAPRVSEQINSYKKTENSAREFQYSGVDCLRIGIKGDVKIKQGDIFKMEAKGNAAALDELIIEQAGTELKISKKRRPKGICIFCLRRTVSAEITLPDLQKFIAFDSVNAEISGFENQDLTVNAGENARVKVHSESGKLKSYVAGINGQIEISGSPSELDAVLEGMGDIRALDLKAEKITIDQSVFSKAVLGGTAKKLQVKSAGNAHLQAFNLKADEVEAELSDSAKAEVSPLNKLRAIVSGSALLLYAGAPGEINRQIFDNGVIKKANGWEEADYAAEASEEIIYHDENGTLQIIFGNDVYSPLLSSARGIELRPEYYFANSENIIFRWQADNGYFVSDWSRPEYVKRLENAGEKIEWTFLEKDDFQQEKKPVIIRLEALDKEYNPRAEAELQLEWIDDMTVKVKQ